MNSRHSLRFHPDVEQDLQKPYSWYEEKLAGLGDDFLQIFYSSIDLITENPLQFPKIYKNYHRYLLRKFPYALYYSIKESGEGIYILTLTSTNLDEPIPLKLSISMERYAKCNCNFEITIEEDEKDLDTSQVESLQMFSLIMVGTAIGLGAALISIIVWGSRKIKLFNQRILSERELETKHENKA